MSRFVNRKSALTVLVVLALLAGFVGGMTMRGGPSHAAGAPFSDLASYVKYIQSNHKAPFDRDNVAYSIKGSNTSSSKQQTFTATPFSGGGSNVKVNQDRNIWPKSELGAAVDPTDGSNYVVMSNDFRENYDHMFYHVSTNGGRTWTDDSMVGGSDPVTGFIPLTFQSDPGVAFDSVGHSFLSTITGNLIFDGFNGYINTDTEIELAQGFAHGRYTSLLPTPIDDQPCSGLFSGTINCPATLDKPLLSVDNVRSSPNKGSIYVYYTLFCNGTSTGGPCTDGSATVPAFSSAILVASSRGAGLPFSAPALVSGSFVNTQFSDMVIDSHGTPHIFFDDFTSFPTINMYESTLSGGSWSVNSTPVASFVYNGLNNLNYFFRDNGAEAPGCDIAGDTAYCAFSASQIGSGRLESTPSVYLATVDTLTGASSIHRVNNDRFNDSKDHFFAWATVTRNGVYVGWYDNRNDNANTKVQYFVGKSTNGGATFPVQQSVSDVGFNPCVGFPFCSFFGDYTQLVSGPDGVVHAAWTDTRDGATQQIFSQSVTF